MKVVAIGLVALSFMLIAACSGPTPAAAPSAPAPATPVAAPSAPAPTPAAPAAAPAPTPAPAPVMAMADRTIDVTIANFRFNPASIEVKPNEAVAFKVTNSDSVGHTFSFTSGGADYNVPVNGSASATGDTVTIAQAGEVQFVCRIHPSMTGTLYVGVTPPASGGTTPSTDSGSDYSYDY